MKRKIIIAFAAVSFLGFLDAIYLTFEKLSGRIPPCGLSGCETVTSSLYSTIFGIPVALIGAIYYFLMFAGSIYVLQTSGRAFFRFLSRASWIGFLGSLWFVSAQLFIIHSICLYCMFSALTSTTLFILGMVNLSHAVDSSS